MTFSYKIHIEKWYFTSFLDENEKNIVSKMAFAAILDLCTCKILNEKWYK